MQMTAACCIANAYESLHLAFVLALIVERNDGEERNEKLGYVAKSIANTYQFGTYEVIYNDFKTFELFYGIHVVEEGPVLDDIELDDEDEDEEDEDEDDDEDYEDGIEEYLPDDCWVKRFVDDDDPNTCYLLYLVINEDGCIEDSGCIEETTQCMGGGGFFFMIPGMNMGGAKSYDYASYTPDKVTDDLKLLFKGHAIPLDFSFIGKRLPQAMIDEGGNGGSNTDYTYALQSA